MMTHSDVDEGKLLDERLAPSSPKKESKKLRTNKRTNERNEGKTGGRNEGRKEGRNAGRREGRETNGQNKRMEIEEERRTKDRERRKENDDGQHSHETKLCITLCYTTVQYITSHSSASSKSERKRLSCCS